MKPFAILLLAVWLANACARDEPAAIDLEPLPPLDFSRFEPGLRDRFSTELGALPAGESVASVAHADAWLAAGMLLQAHGIEDQAAICYRNAQRLYESYGAVYLSAFLQHQNGDLEAAIAGYRLAIALDPQAVAPFLRLGEIGLQLGDTTMAAKAFGQAAILQPGLAAASSGLGRVALASQDYAQARDDLEAALSAEPEADQLYYPLGLAYRGLGDLDRAREHLARRGSRQAGIPDPWLERVQSRKATSQTHIKRGLAAYESGDLATAAQYYRLALASQPGLADTHLALAWVLEQLGDYDAAIRHCDEALRLDPGEAKAWYQRGRLYDRAGDDNAAAQAYRAALERSPEALPPRELLADTLMRLARYDEAANQYALRLQHGSSTPRLLYMQGLSRVAAGRCPDAQATLLQAWQDNRASAEAAEALIRVSASCARSGLWSSAETVELATELFRALAEAPFAESLAMAYAADGQYNQARDLQQRVVNSGQASEFSRELLTRFSAGQPAETPWPGDSPVYAVPRLGQTR